MKEYSPIKKIYIRNFRNLGDVIVDFEESPIISLIGENESGKTSIVKAFAVCALNDNTKTQRGFIRDGTRGFGVGIELVDGTLITREKGETFNRYKVAKDSQTIWASDKTENDLPIAVQDAMGLIVEPETKEYLQVRTYENQLLFVTTMASTNYKVMYDALKVDSLTRAIKLGSNEANQLKSAISENETGISTLTDSIRTIKIVDIQSALTLRTRLESELKILEKLEEANDLRISLENRKYKLGKLSDLLKSGLTINELEADKIQGIKEKMNLLANLLRKYSIISVSYNAQLVDYSTNDIIAKAIQIKHKIEEQKHKIQVLSSIGGFEAVSVSMVMLMSQCWSSALKLKELLKLSHKLSLGNAQLVQDSDSHVVIELENMLNIINTIKSYKDAVRKLEEYCLSVRSYLASLGIDCETCPKCGETIIIDVTKYKVSE